MKKKEVQLNVRLPKDLVDEFKQLVLQKHGKLYLAMKSEVEFALRLWIALHKNPDLAKSMLQRIIRGGTQTHKVPPQFIVNAPLKVWKVYKEVDKKVRELMGSQYDPFQVPEYIILEAIRHVRGTDERTVMKWFREFLKYKLIKRIQGDMYEML